MENKTREELQLELINLREKQLKFANYSMHVILMNEKQLR